MNGFLRTVLRAVLSVGLCVTPALVPDASAAGAEGAYTSGSTAVVRANGSAVVDEGVMTCSSVNGDHRGAGGFCVPFGGGDALTMNDSVAGQDVAFQVCVDNSGDGVCTSPDVRTSCPDYVTFSHDDAGNFYNPVGPLPTGFDPGCGAGAYQGYVVFVCEGVHVGGSPHVHPAGGGSGQVVTGGEGHGTFCGGDPNSPAPSRKRYRHADEPSSCQVAAFAQPTLTGGTTNFFGYVTGAVTAAQLGGAPNDPVELECGFYIAGLLDSRHSATGTGAALLTSGHSYSAFLNTDLAVCGRAFVAGIEHDLGCADVAASEGPEPEDRALVDAVNRKVHQDVDPIICPTLATLTGVYGPVQVGPDGDVTAGGTLVLDCPPYDFLAPPPSALVPDVYVVATGGTGIL